MLPVIFGLSGPVMTAAERALFRDTDPAGFILFARNIEDPEQLRALTDSLRDLTGRAAIPILIDQEGGRVTRLGPPHWRSWPAAQTLAGSANCSEPERLASAVERVRCNFEALALELAGMGVTVTCAPVLDVPQPDAHDIIGDRAFGASAELVSILGSACLEGLQLGGVAGVIKHLPGHGRALSDSHESLPRVSATAAELEQDFAPFRALSNASMAMTAHVVYDALDKAHCASLSPTVIETHIRQHIGFDGLLISDDLDMKALAGDIPSRAVAVLEAGCDIALNCWGKLEDMQGIAERVPPMTSQAAARLQAACAPLRIAEHSSALQSRIDALLASRDALA